MAGIVLTYVLAAAACTAALAIARLVLGGADENFALSTALSFLFFFVAGGLAWRIGALFARESLIARSFVAWGGVALVLLVWDLAPRMANRPLGEAADVLIINLPVFVGGWLGSALVWGAVFRLRRSENVQTTDVAA
ncbi:hypothetical protein DDZ18_06110 [Marinicauda salina]|uniref:Uncharacterized protein n=1 Tax=Marinicauda salina TaxID=2135793 RepID=A0A2U2BTD3_9PROT|nr:hypothetical protein [Marinicauda salina]PWE17262.1 hypothetical protein DDZ18_06110 [Marinicauda salina]